MFAKLTDTSQAAVYSVQVLFMATGAALFIRLLDLNANLGMWISWSCTPTVAALLMLHRNLLPGPGEQVPGWGTSGY
jgi:hypothetical protein